MSKTAPFRTTLTRTITLDVLLIFLDSNDSQIMKELIQLTTTVKPRSDAN